MERTFRVEPLVDVTEIPTDNEGIKCGSGNKEFLKVDLKANKQEDCWTNKDGDGCCFENQEARRDLGVEGTLIQLDIGFRKGEVNQSGKHGREIKPCLLPRR